MYSLFYNSHFPMWMLLLLLVPYSLYAEVCSICRCGDVRLLGGDTNLEGRVEICLNGVWGRVGGNFWNLKNAQVVCRQLGFSGQHTRFCNVLDCFGTGNGTVYFTTFDCKGGESRLIDCMSDQTYSTHEYNENDTTLVDAGVFCDNRSSTGPPQNVSVQASKLNTTITWTPPIDATELLISYEVTCSTDSNIQLQTMVENTTLDVTFQACDSYSIHTCCVSSVYEGSTLSSKSCTDSTHNTSNTESTEPDVSNNNNTTTTIHETTSGMPNQNDKSNVDAVGGVLGFIIIVLVILLALACLAIAYPRCIRPRIKERGYLSSVRSVLDRTLHNPTYDANDGARQQHTDNININTKNHPSMQSNSLLGHEYETIDSRITPRNRQRNQQRQQDTGISGSQEVSHDLQVTASSGQYEVCNTSYAIPEPNQNNNGHSDIDPSRYEVSEAYINAAGNTGHTITDELDNATGPELDADGYAHLEH